jgi:hypothetical protein
MARVSAILRALYAAFRRDWKSFGSIAVNNFFPVTLFFLRQAGVFLYLIAGAVVLFPMSTDPLRKIPRSRLDSWPLSAGERRLLRLLSPWVNPVTWLLAGLAVWAVRGRLTAGVWALVAAIFLAGFTLSELPVARGVWFWRRVPPFPGPLNQLIRKNIREILSTLDFYLALTLTLAATAWRVFGPPLPREAYLQMALLSLLALSSYTQCLFGLDGEGGLSRYRLLPLPGWKILAAKDAAFLAVAVALSLPLAPAAGLGAALVILAFGHGPSVRERREQVRWRFSTGVSLYFGFVQVIAMAMAGAAVEFASPAYLLVCGGVWGGSLWWYGRTAYHAVAGVP